MILDIIADILPYLHSHTAKALSSFDKAESISEIRLTLNKPVIVTVRGQTILLKAPGGQSIMSDKNAFMHTVNMLSGGSLYSIGESIKQGFVTLRGGHRVGICGTAVLKDGRVHTIKDISSLCFRICRQITGCADDIYRDICKDGHIHNSLIASPPGYGKTTILRDLCRSLATGSSMCGVKRVGIADERCEIAAMHEGVSRFDLGLSSFVCSGYPKRDAMLLMLRCMCPDVIITDEIGSFDEYEAVREALKCGVSVIASVHALDLEDLIYRFGSEVKSFEYIYFIENRKRGYKVYRRCRGDY